jgi:hypothetical protein
VVHKLRWERSQSGFGRIVGYTEAIQFDGLSANRRLRADDMP